MGVGPESVVHDEAQLRRQLERVFDRYQQPVLVERYIEGREITMGIVGNLVSPVARRMPEDENAPRIFKGLHIFPALEVDLGKYPIEEAGIYSNRIKSARNEDFHYLCPAPLPESLVEDLRWYTAAAFRVTGCLDVARVDFRLDMHDNNKPYVLEINPLPGLTPGFSDLCLEAATAGWTYEGLINRILDEAAGRYGLELS
jgi:D-alanine-D-alanine ligase